jgi:isoleucyl-tRNA synthetase
LLNSEGGKVDYTYLNPKAEAREIVEKLNTELIEIDEEDEEFLDKIVPEFARDNPKENLRSADKWIISRLNKTALRLNRALDAYQFTKPSTRLSFFLGRFLRLVYRTRQRRNHVRNNQHETRSPRGRGFNRFSNRRCGCCTRLCLF